MKKRSNKKKILRKIIPLLIVLILAFIVYWGYKQIFLNLDYSDYNFLETIETSTYASIDKYAIYGIHMNFEGSITLTEDFKEISLVLANGNTEITLPFSYEQEDNVYTFYTSEYINEGLVLEDIPVDTYYLLIKTTTEDMVKYYSVTNETDYSDLEYYTLTSSNSNNKIDIEWNTYEEIPTLRFKVTETTLPDDVYDITIDPGHDANDAGKSVCLLGTTIYDPSSTGVCYNGGTLYKESDANLIIALELKSQLEALGYKVAITRETDKDTVETYGSMGSATMANDTSSKFNIAIHHNSSGVDGGISYLYGLELYIANDTNLDLANIFVQNITTYANTSTSIKSLYQISDGIYQRFFTEAEIAETDYWTTNMIYYYYLREVGGISTHAAQNIARNGYAKNEYYNSNNTAESYLFELGYMDNYQDLLNITNNSDGYAKGIVNALTSYLETEKN